MPLTQQEAIIGKLHDICAYPQQWAALLEEGVSPHATGAEPRGYVGQGR
jgi:hypothetical protein